MTWRRPLLLADRVLVMDGGVIAYETTVDLPRPRDIADPRFAALRARLLDRLGVGGTGTAEAAGRPVETAVSAATRIPVAGRAALRHSEPPRRPPTHTDHPSPPTPHRRPQHPNRTDSP